MCEKVKNQYFVNGYDTNFQFIGIYLFNIMDDPVQQQQQYQQTISLI